MNKPEYHIPALFFECLDGLAIKPDGVYVDLTLGGGGHSRGILEKLGTHGKLVCFDQDEEAAKNAPDDPRVVFVKQNFRYVEKMLRFSGVGKADGVLADLGVSFHQFDKAERGFSIRTDSQLDMRMDTAQKLTAKEVVNKYEAEELARIFGQYGEIKAPFKLVNAITNVRGENPIQTTYKLLDILAPFTPKDNKGKKKFQAQVFQALRIEVNHEMKALEEMLLQLPAIVKPGGRVAIISYHSLEDRMVKNFLKTGDLGGKVEKDFYGNVIRPFKPLHSKPIIPGEKEIENNPRSRSAKLRVAERTND